MLLQILPTRATGDAVRNLTRHLLDKPEDNDEIKIVIGSREDAFDALADAERFNRKSCLQQFILTSKEDITSAQVKRSVDALAAEFGFTRDDIMLAVRHQKSRQDDAGCDRHWHVLVRNVNPEHGRVIKMSHSYARGEKVARMLEAEFGFALVNGKHSRAVLNAVPDDMKGKLSALADMPEPESAYSKRQHQKAKRAGVSLPEIRAFMRNAWKESGGSWSAFRTSVNAAGYHICRGTKKPDVLVLADGEGKVLGSVTRLTGVKNADFLQAQRFDKQSAAPVPAPPPAIPSSSPVPSSRPATSSPHAPTSRPAAQVVHHTHRHKHHTRLATSRLNLRVKGMTKEQIDALEVMEDINERQRRAVEASIRLMEEIADSWFKDDGWSDISRLMQKVRWPDLRPKPWPKDWQRDKYDMSLRMQEVMRPAWDSYQSSRKSWSRSTRRAGLSELETAMSECNWVCSVDDVVKHNDIKFSCDTAASRLVALRKLDLERWSDALENSGRLADVAAVEAMAQDIHRRRDRDMLARFLENPRTSIEDHKAAQAAIAVPPPPPPPPPAQSRKRVRKRNVGPSVPGL